jgi:hypothetical protein
VADLFTPTTHFDGENYTAAQVNRLEAGLDAVDTELDAQTDRIDSLFAAGGAGGDASQVPSGTSAARATVTPAIGRLFFDTDLGKLLVGTGSTWVNTDGSAVTATGGGGGGSVPGTGTSPQNMVATVTAGGSIGQINMSWDAVAGASFYTLYESTSPNGVSGATALTTTSTSRTPGTARNYDYWVTATLNGVESAASNHVTATLPFGGGGSTGSTGADPSTFLNINGLGTGTGGIWNEGIGKLGGHVDIDPTTLKTYIESPYYTLNATGTGVQFQVPLAGGTTSINTHYPRSELREYSSLTTKASWSGSSGRHIMRGASRVMHMGPIKPEVVVAQVHDASDDTLQIHVTGSSATGPQTWRIKVNGSTVATPLTNVALGTEVAWDVDVNNGVLTVKLNGSTAYTGSPGWGSGQYFKVGCYAQQNTTDQANSSSEYSRVELRNLFVSHS